MRCAIPHPCIDSSASVLKISRSSVPCSKSEVAAIFPSTFDNRMLLPPVECQGKVPSRVAHPSQSHRAEWDDECSAIHNTLAVAYPLYLPKPKNRHFDRSPSRIL